ncbi:hypothetical protein ACFCZ4_17515 [Streptomyces microflavus]|uniref:hypothetical protein n=1 Tax=Streptomyces TaxID=1883 RepID=UPI002E7635DF|nr:hypothetical protein [Streptomyces sp. BE282]MEE1730691.1 hypothetical protein [Streptomyces sp. BE282]
MTNLASNEVEALAPRIAYELITPTAAAEIQSLTRRHCCNPRRLDPAHARRLARDMASGLWDEDNPEVICICGHGAVIQGQHRLEAVIISDLPRRFLVSRGVPHSASVTMDSGKTRSAAVALSTAGVERYRKDLSSTVKLLRLYDVERKTTPWTAWSSSSFTNSEIVGFFQSDYQDLAEQLPQMNALKSALWSAPSASLASSYLLYRDGGEIEVAEFLQGLVSGANLGETDPRWVLRRFFLNPTRNRRGSAVSPHQIGLFLKCWNLWITGETWEISYFRPNETMPLVISVTDAAQMREMRLEFA